MAIRHFRRQREQVTSGSSSDTETSDVSEQDTGAGEGPTEAETRAEGAEQGAWERAPSVAGSEAGESDEDDSESSSSDDEEVVLHRPVFLKKRDPGAGPAARTGAVSGAQERTLDQVQHHNAVQDKERALKQIATSYSTDKELLHRIAQLETDGDTDSDSERREHELWAQRRHQRMLRLREEERRRQSELEENEAARLTNSALPMDDAGIQTAGGAERGTRPASSSDARKRRGPEAKFKPSKVQKPQLKRTASPSRADENEFSIL
ncbi:AER038Cp [Eremothecium gossypii ATCC 10895]|uniref:Pre-mRNA-splicing factor SPP381 n=1 Tax=Eremothecium gossypii (strain ATCC 10895 / CBS 109.51 / FGSC 9923 / NRRL Y-1056) TaxID=284811 RepID=SP381_EREGS|nr:AER038Cp [Eremothecium gossypii ATCC 10895]Q757H5.1 RecName: Full=Pre-mRNA-splicing factor SPP381 [Eremothecium gossypii ATCC 10895]AAS52722.1 AER038Cp [Eremothecium gossypii ATCC 10895]